MAVVDTVAVVAAGRRARKCIRCYGVSLLAAGFDAHAISSGRGGKTIIVMIANPDARTPQGDSDELYIIDILERYFL